MYKYQHTCEPLPGAKGDFSFEKGDFAFQREYPIHKEGKNGDFSFKRGTFPPNCPNTFYFKIFFKLQIL